MHPHIHTRPLNPFLRNEGGLLPRVHGVSAKFVSLCAVGVLATFSAASAQSLPAPVEDPAVELDSGAGVSVTPEPLVQGFPTVPEDPQLAVTPDQSGLVVPFDPSSVGEQSSDSLVPEEEPVVELEESPWFFGPQDFDPAFGYSPAVMGGWGGYSDPNRGFSTGFGGYPIGANPYFRLLDGLSLSATLAGFYNTNPSMGYGDPDDDGEGDFGMTLGGSIGYQTAGGEWTFGFRYSGSYTEYFTQSDLSGFGQSASVFATYEGGPLTVTTTLGIGFASGANRYYESVVDELSLSLGVSARYQYSAITSFEGYFGTGLISPGGDLYENTSSYSFGGSMLWRYSPLLEFGPGIAIGVNSGDFQEDRVTYGPTMTVNYKVTDLVSLSGRIGLDFVDYEDSGAEGPDLALSLVASYRPSPIWGMSLAIGQGTQVDPGQSGSFNQTTYLSLGYNRTLPFGSWNIGVAYEHLNEEIPDKTSIGAGRGDRDFYSINTSLSMPLFADTCTGSIFASYSDQSSSGNNGSWGSFSTGFSISRSF